MPHKGKNKKGKRVILEADKPLSWGQGAFSSKDERLIPIQTREAAYCFLDETLLVNQGCCLDNIEEFHFRFDGRHIKKLSGEHFRDDVRLPGNGEIEEITYTHELKINKIDRILLFPLQSDHNNACLYVGARYVKKGLHCVSQIKSVSLSGKQGAPLEIHWPTRVSYLSSSSSAASGSRRMFSQRQQRHGDIVIEDDEDTTLVIQPASSGNIFN